jgi:hypothetical protein
MCRMWNLGAPTTPRDHESQLHVGVTSTRRHFGGRFPAAPPDPPKSGCTEATSICARTFVDGIKLQPGPTNLHNPATRCQGFQTGVAVAAVSRAVCGSSGSGDWNPCPAPEIVALTCRTWNLRGLRLAMGVWVVLVRHIQRTLEQGVLFGFGCQVWPLD